MFILKGRLNGDKDGNFTCSVVDYCISTKVILALSTNISQIFSTIELTLPGVMSSPGRDNAIIRLLKKIRR
jgi:hypothetical protein